MLIANPIICHCSEIGIHNGFKIRLKESRGPYHNPPQSKAVIAAPQNKAASTAPTNAVSINKSGKISFNTSITLIYQQYKHHLL